MIQENYNIQGSQQRDPQSPHHYGHEHMHHPYYHTTSYPHGQHYIHVHHHHHYHYHHVMRDQNTTQP
ncbi:hypothetical protein J23TS9_08930 [Paenibacillus sp. J23TS9]|nr:hypothetical protein J23TS9_08930 [Paenibacillus sp. J23TS9]